MSVLTSAILLATNCSIRKTEASKWLAHAYPASSSTRARACWGRAEHLGAPKSLARASRACVCAPPHARASDFQNGIKSVRAGENGVSFRLSHGNERCAALGAPVGRARCRKQRCRQNYVHQKIFAAFGGHERYKILRNYFIL